MARGRMLNVTVCTSKKMDSLCDDTCRLLATWIIPHLDYNGVFYADPALVRSLVFPRKEISPETIDGYLLDMQKVGLIVLFDDDGERWQWWPGFADNQVGLRKERERSSYPLPPTCRKDAANLPPTCRQDDDNVTPECRLKLTEIKRTEGEYAPCGADSATPPFCASARRKAENKVELFSPPLPDHADDNVMQKCCHKPAAPIETEGKCASCSADPPPDLFRAEARRQFENTIGLFSPLLADQVDDMLAELEAKGAQEWWPLALREAEAQNKRSWSYVRAILTRCLQENKPPGVRGKARDAPKQYHRDANGFIILPTAGGDDG